VAERSYFSNTEFLHAQKSYDQYVGRDIDSGWNLDAVQAKFVIRQRLGAALEDDAASTETAVGDAKGVKVAK